jgi:glycosyltransferase involved in cell wall biosynthesis
MKILVVTNMYPTQGRPNWGSFVKSQIDSVVLRGVEVELLVIDGYRSKLAYAFAFLRFWKRCLTARYDLVHAHYGLCGIIARTQYRFPVVLSFCGDDLYGHADRTGKATRNSLFITWVHKHLARHIDGVIVKSDAMRRMLPGERAEVIPNGVDFDLFRPLSRQACRHTLGLSPDRVYILFPYSPDRLRKNYSLVVEAVAVLNASEPTPRYEILIVSDRPAEDMPLFMNSADLLVLVSFWEGSPNVVKEAMACNLRVVAADVGDVREQIEGVTGCVLCERNLDDLVRQIRTVLEMPCRTTGREAIEHLRAERVADRVIQLYRKVKARSWQPPYTDRSSSNPRGRQNFGRRHSTSRSPRNGPLAAAPDASHLGDR